MDRIDGKFWGICSTCNQNRPIAYKVGESPHHQWCCVDCDAPTKAEVELLKKSTNEAWECVRVREQELMGTNRRQAAEIAKLRAELAEIHEYGTTEINAAVELRQEVARLRVENQEMLDRLTEDGPYGSISTNCQAQIEVLEEVLGEARRAWDEADRVRDEAYRAWYEADRVRDEADRAWYEARRAWYEADRAYDEAYRACVEASRAYREASRARDEAERALREHDNKEATK